ncbi:multidrug ABC transporter substrate-binding protein [Parabacteroides sp. PF5-6]|uniref:ABC transporter permease n=1 Tax=Parabacteroides sp. PF5-6 TaxID=1742403 RepID=UPI0024067D91|nr:multidrug ABC transporter substrate-binding protein [Parabacteroides sp. PF5-6]MDF9829415.1 hypothetical protein [Parabacteroides sp. PF5-6]
MFKQIIKTIWHQRRANGWIFAEILVVTGVLWYMADNLLVEYSVYNQPLGYDIENCWRLKLANLNSDAEGFVPAEELTTTQGEDLRTLMDHLRREPLVDGVCATYYSCPYAFGNSWTSLEPMDGDTAVARTQSYHVRRVTPEYFDVFRVKDKQGNAITPQLPAGEDCLVISKDMETRFFGEGAEGKGKRVKYYAEGESHPIVAVSEPIRYHEFKISEPCYFQVLAAGKYTENVEMFGARSAEVCVRFKRAMTQDELYAFLESMGGRLTVNNLYVYGAMALSDQREILLSDKINTAKIQIALISFMLINVFFGIIGTFWLRTQYRRGEIGLRVALGSSRQGIYRYMNEEGLCLLVLSLPVLFIVAANMIYFDILESVRIPITLWRIVSVCIGSYVLMGLMICLGIWVPAKKAAGLAPAEALRYE